MSGNTTHAGLNITDSKLQLVEIHFDGSGFLLENIDEVYYKESLNLRSEKKTKILSLLQSSFDELNVRRPISAKNVSFTLPLDLFTVVQMPFDDNLYKQELIEQFRWELSVLYPHLNSAELVIQSIEVQKNTFIRNNSAIVVAIQRKYLQLISDFAKENDLQLNFIDNAHFAADRIIAYNGYISDGTNITLYFANKVLSVLVFAEGQPIFAKLMRLQHAGEITRYLMDEIFNNPEISLSKKDLQAVFIHGENLTDTIIQTLEKNLDLAFHQINPFQHLTINPDLANNNYYSEHYSAFAAGTGIAIRIA